MLTTDELYQLDDLSGAALYSAEVKRIPFLTRTEEAAYIEAARAGSLEASSAQRNSAFPRPLRTVRDWPARKPTIILAVHECRERFWIPFSDLRRRRWHPAKTAGALRFVSRALHILPQTTRHLCRMHSSSYDRAKGSAGTFQRGSLRAMHSSGNALL